MPWYGDQYSYPPLVVRLIFETYMEREEAAPARPHSTRSAELYDFKGAMEGLGLSPHQVKLMNFRLLGFTWRQIAAIVGVPYSTIYKRGVIPEKELMLKMAGTIKKGR